MNTSDCGTPTATDVLDPVIEDVRTRFVADFPLRCDAAAALIDGTANDETREKSAKSLRSMAHRVAGLAGIIGFRRVSTLASELEGLAEHFEAGMADRNVARALVESMRAAFVQELVTPEQAIQDRRKGVDRGTILVAEDDDDQRAVVMRHLSEAGYRTEGVEAGNMVLPAARAVPPSVVLLDVEMPGLDGYAVCRELKADAALSTVPVVFMTTRARIDDRLAGLALGADDYLIKPVDPRELIVRLQRVRSVENLRAEQAATAGVLSFEDFLEVARSRLKLSAACLVLMRLPAEHLNVSAVKVRDEIRRADVAATYDRTHLLLLLPGLSGAVARSRTTGIIAHLAERGVDNVSAGVALASTPGAKSIEALMQEADEALMQARLGAKSIAVHGDKANAQGETATTTVLVADDDPDVIRIIDAQLRGAGYRTTLAFDGQEALAAMDLQRPDVLVVDVMMPKLSGFDLLTRLNQSAEGRPKVLVLSARGREDDVTHAFELGADDYVTKPFNPQELLARVARLLR